MKTHFTESCSSYSYEFIEDNNLPELKNITCVFAFVKFQGKLYLTKNFRGWELPGGHIEKGENLEQALERELAEEIGTKVFNSKLFGYKKITNFQKNKNRDGGFYPFPHSYILFYICEGTGEDYKISCPDTLDYGLFDIKECFEKVDSKGTRRIIEIMKEYSLKK